jgi:hypothetical protein
MTDQIIARFIFHPEYASQFLFDEGQTVSELVLDNAEEALDYVVQFEDALVDASFLINGRVVELADFKGEAK